MDPRDSSWRTPDRLTDPRDRWNAGFHDVGVYGLEDRIGRLQHPTRLPRWDTIVEDAIGEISHEDDGNFDVVMPLVSEVSFSETSAFTVWHRKGQRQRTTIRKKREVRKPPSIPNVTLRTYLKDRSREYSAQRRASRKVFLLGLLENATTLEERLSIQLDLIALRKAGTP